jgi:hypothetical protein
MCGAVTPLLQQFFMAWCLVKHIIRIHGVMVLLVVFQIYLYKYIPCTRPLVSLRFVKQTIPYILTYVLTGA